MRPKLNVPKLPWNPSFLNFHSLSWAIGNLWCSGALLWGDNARSHILVTGGLLWGHLYLTFFSETDVLTFLVMTGLFMFLMRNDQKWPASERQEEEKLDGSQPLLSTHLPSSQPFPWSQVTCAFSSCFLETCVLLLGTAALGKAPKRQPSFGRPAFDSPLWPEVFVHQMS